MSKNLLSELLEDLTEKKKIDEDFVQKLESLSPDMSLKALEIVNRGIVKYIFNPSNRIVWVVRGNEKEYLIYPRLFCSCKSFYKSVVSEKRNVVCKHIIAQLISEALQTYQTKEAKDEEFKALLKELDLKL